MAIRKSFRLVSPFSAAGDQQEAVESLVSGMNAGRRAMILKGVTGSGKTFTMANLIASLNRPTMIMSHNKTLAAQLYGEMKGFFPENAVEYFVSYYDYYQPEAYVPASDTYIDKDASINEHIDQMRLSATKSLMERRDTIVVCSVSAIYGLGEPENYLKMLLHLSAGEKISQREILEKLAVLQYERNDLSLVRASFRVRGDVIDLFPSESDDLAVRIELFDDEIESLSLFDPLTGKVESSLSEFTVFPKNHYVTPKEVIDAAVSEIRSDLKERCDFFLSQRRLLEEQRLRERTGYDLELLTEIGHCPGIENYSRYFTGRKPGEAPPCLFDYLPEDGLLIIDESHVTVPQIGAMYRGDRARKKNLIDFGFRLPSAADNRPLKFEEFEAMQPQTLYVSATPAKYELEKAGDSGVVEQIIRPTGILDPEIEIRKVETQVDDVMSEIRTLAGRNERVLVTVLTKRMAEDLTDYLTEHSLRVRYMHSDIDAVERMDIIRDLRRGEFDALIGINLLREGLDIPEVALVAVLDADKEGFLRSANSLIQTIGRAARNVKGRAVFYADKITDSMRSAIEETNRRRAVQRKFNEEHGITPKQIRKEITDVMEMAISSSASYKFRDGSDNRIKRGETSLPSDGSREERIFEDIAREAKEEGVAFDKVTAESISARIGEYSKRMQSLARELRFEEAAAVRDRIGELKRLLLQLPKDDAVGTEE